MTKYETAEVFSKDVSYRTPVKAARFGNSWIIFSENMMNGGKHLESIIENRYYLVDGETVRPISPMDFPGDLEFEKF